MARGKAAKPGDTRTAPNGYHYTRTEKEWRLTHHIVAEQTLGRPLTEDERVEFIDRDRKNLKAGNLRVIKKGRGSVRRRIAQIEERIRELEAQKADLEAQLAKG
jgi:hypothetical protein